MNELAQVAGVEGSQPPTIRVTGEIDLSNVDAVREAVGAAIPDDAHVVVLDLSGVAYLDSAAIAMLFRLAERLGRMRQRLEIVVPSSSPILAVLRLTDLASVIPVREID